MYLRLPAERAGGLRLIFRNRQTLPLPHNQSVAVAQFVKTVHGWRHNLAVCADR